MTRVWLNWLAGFAAIILEAESAAVADSVQEDQKKINRL